MRYDYVVTLKRDHEKYIDATSIFLCILSILAFLFIQIQQHKFNWFFSFATALLMAGLIINIFFQRNKKKSSDTRTGLLLPEYSGSLCHTCNGFLCYFSSWLFWNTRQNILWKLALPKMWWLSIVCSEKNSCGMISLTSY